MNRRSATAILLAVLFGTGNAGSLPTVAAQARPTSLCRVDELIVYSCRFAKKLGSVCLGQGTLAYRFGRPSKPEIAIENAPDWSNVHTGANYSQAGLTQQHIRFTKGAIHYVVHAGETGSLNETPGRRISGIVVLGGTDGTRNLADFDCREGSGFAAGSFGRITQTAPDGWDGSETTDGPFDAVY